jgi:hypothetical protein
MGHSASLPWLKKRQLQLELGTRYYIKIATQLHQISDLEAKILQTISSQRVGTPSDWPDSCSESDQGTAGIFTSQQPVTRI